MTTSHNGRHSFEIAGDGRSKQPFEFDRPSQRFRHAIRAGMVEVGQPGPAFWRVVREDEDGAVLEYGPPLDQWFDVEWWDAFCRAAQLAEGLTGSAKIVYVCRP